MVTSEVGPFSPGPIMTTVLALPIALAIDSASWKVDSTALRRFDSSFDMICIHKNISICAKKFDIFIWFINVALGIILDKCG